MCNEEAECICESAYVNCDGCKLVAKNGIFSGGGSGEKPHKPDIARTVMCPKFLMLWCLGQMNVQV